MAAPIATARKAIGSLVTISQVNSVPALPAFDEGFYITDEKLNVGALSRGRERHKCLKGR